MNLIQKTISFESFPGEILAHIFSFDKNIEPFSLINKRCYFISREDPRWAPFFTKKALSLIFLDGLQAHEECLKLSAPYTTTLDFSRHKITRSLIKDIARRLPHLRILNLYLARGLAADMLEELKGLKNLKELNIGQFIFQNSSLISYSSYELPLKLDFLKNHRRLESLNISGWAYHYSELEKLIRVPNLKKLNLEHPWVPQLDNLNFLQFTTNLAELSLGFGNTDLKPNSLKALCHVPKLRSLSLTSSGVRGPDLQNLVFVPRLLSLSLGSTCYKGNIIGERHLSNLKFTEQLTKLDLSELRCSNFGLKCLNQVPNISDLSLLGCRDIGDEELDNLLYIPDLKKLVIGPYNYYFRDLIRIGSHRLITDKGVEKLKCLKKLTHLTFVCCNGITKEACLHLKEYTSLKSLKFYHCDRIGSSTINYLKELKHLEKLVIYQCQRIKKSTIKNLTNELNNTEIIYKPPNFYIN